MSDKGTSGRRRLKDSSGLERSFGTRKVGSRHNLHRLHHTVAATAVPLDDREHLASEGRFKAWLALNHIDTSRWVKDAEDLRLELVDGR